jgi:DNA-binding PadR family transcriptional regulator
VQQLNGAIWSAPDDSRGPGSRMPRGMLKYAILFLLSERDSHGYELLAQIKARRWGAPGPGSIYPLLGTLESGSLIGGRDEDGKRIYRITELGRQTLVEHSKRLRELTAERGTDGEPTASDEEQRLRASGSKLMQTVAHMNSASDPRTLDQISSILDRARREIYNVLAQE